MRPGRDCTSRADANSGQRQRCRLIRSAEHAPEVQVGSGGRVSAPAVDRVTCELVPGGAWALRTRVVEAGP
jgi:hypothetical protein